jgi:hypothetical protein
MIRFVLSLAFSLAVLFSFAQNLVPNPSFELTTLDCEPNPGLQGWYSPNLATPNLFSMEEELCGTFLSEQLMEELSFIAPLTGSNMVGLFCAYPETSNLQTREYLTCRLVETLVLGVTYRVTFSTYRRHSTSFAIDKLGVHFSSDSLFYDVADMLPVTPQWESNELHTISDQWTSYEFFYTAYGGEQYLTFGCFRDFDEMEVVDLQTSLTDHNRAYYLFDDFSVERSVTVETPIAEEFTITAARSGLNIVTNEKGVLILSNTQGQVILQVPVDPGEKRILFTTQAAGIYLATLISDRRRKSTQFFWH